MVKNPPANAGDEGRRSRVPALGWEDPLKKVMSTHPSILARKVPQTEEPGGTIGYSPQGGRESDDLATEHLQHSTVETSCHSDFACCSTCLSRTKLSDYLDNLWSTLTYISH